MVNAPAASSDDRARLLSRMRSRPLLWRMMAHLGIDPRGRWWHGAESMVGRVVARCVACPSTDECVSWLARSAPDGHPPGFCPNNRALEACHIMAPDATPKASPEPEPRLPEMLGEPIVRQLMTADRVDHDRLRQAMNTALGLAATATAKATRR